MEEEVGSLLRKGAIEHEETLEFFSYLFLVPKKEGGRRPVINLKPLNQYIRKKPFRMTTLKEVGQSIRQGDWSITIDLQDAFLHVPMHKDYRRFPRFSWNEKIYQFCRLPFGLTSFPQVFTDITTPLVEFCRIRGIRVIFYLDDILVLASSRTLLCQHRDFVLKLLLDVGFKRNIKKCWLTPSQVFPYLGLDWNTIEMQVSLPHSKLDQIRDMISVMEQTPTIKTRDCMVLLGKINYAATAIPLARLHCRPLQFCLPRLTYDLSLSDSRMTLTQEARDSLRWWSSPLLNGRSLKIHLPAQVISTDASLTGWGAQMGQLSIHGLWTNTEKQNHINYLELKTVLFALQHWLHQLKHQTVALQLDNTTAVAYLLKEGGHTIQIPALLSSGDSDLGQPKQDSAAAKLSTRSDEYASRRSVTFEGARRMDVGSYSSKEDFLDLRHADSRLVCVREKQAGSPLLHDGPARSPRLRNGRASTELGLQEPVALCLHPPPPSA